MRSTPFLMRAAGVFLTTAIMFAALIVIAHSLKLPSEQQSFLPGAGRNAPDPGWSEIALDDEDTDATSAIGTDPEPVPVVTAEPVPTGPDGTIALGTSSGDGVGTAAAVEDDTGDTGSSDAGGGSDAGANDASGNDAASGSGGTGDGGSSGTARTRSAGSSGPGDGGGTGPAPSTHQRTPVTSERVTLEPSAPRPTPPASPWPSSPAWPTPAPAPSAPAPSGSPADEEPPTPTPSESDSEEPSAQRDVGSEGPSEQVTAAE